MVLDILVRVRIIKSTNEGCVHGSHERNKKPRGIATTAGLLALCNLILRSIVVAVQLEHGGKGLAGELDTAQLAHLLFALLLLFQQDHFLSNFSTLV